MKTINIEVSDDTAKKIEQLKKTEKDELSRLIDTWVSKPRPILEVMEELGEYAAKQGMTKEKLDDLLKDE